MESGQGPFQRLESVVEPGDNEVDQPTLQSSQSSQTQSDHLKSAKVIEENELFEAQLRSERAQLRRRQAGIRYYLTAESIALARSKKITKKMERHISVYPAVLFSSQHLCHELFESPVGWNIPCSLCIKKASVHACLKYGCKFFLCSGCSKRTACVESQAVFKHSCSNLPLGFALRPRVLAVPPASATSTTSSATNSPVKSSSGKREKEGGSAAHSNSNQDQNKDNQDDGDDKDNIDSNVTGVTVELLRSPGMTAASTWNLSNQVRDDFCVKLVNGAVITGCLLEVDGTVVDRADNLHRVPAAAAQHALLLHVERWKQTEKSSLLLRFVNPKLLQSQSKQAAANQPPARLAKQKSVGDPTRSSNYNSRSHRQHPRPRSVA